LISSQVEPDNSKEEWSLSRRLWGVENYGCCQPHIIRTSIIFVIASI
jgi:hypothetical protein